MQVRPCRDAFARDLEEGCGPKSRLKLLEEGKAGLLRRLRPQQCPKCPTVNGAIGFVLPHGKDQGLDIRPPTCFLRQVETARPLVRALTRRKISQAATSPISQAAFVRAMRITIAAVKAPAPPRKGVAANSTSS